MVDDLRAWVWRLLNYALGRKKKESVA
jgi:hypothetical protein